MHFSGAVDASPNLPAGKEDAATPAHAASILQHGRRGSGLDHNGKTATESPHTPKGSRFADTSGEAAVVAAVRAKLASSSGKPPYKHEASKLLQG